MSGIKTDTDKMYPKYLNLSQQELDKRIESLFDVLKKCEICPRKCHIDRTKEKTGFCKLGKLPVVSAFDPHFGEETPLAGKFGSGTIFFTSCNLACVYCQNYDISQLRVGQETSFKKLAEMMISLQNQGCHNINLVTPTPQVPQILKSLSIAINLGLEIPLVYNTSTYDSVEILKSLDGIVDIYMPDAKYSDDKIALKYSIVPSYFKVMKQAIKEMHRQVGDLVIDKSGIAVKGLIVRHLVLPNNLAGSEEIFKFLSQEISKNTFLNIMNQYRPCHKAVELPGLSRAITQEEYQEAIFMAKSAGLERLYLR